MTETSQRDIGNRNGEKKAFSLELLLAVCEIFGCDMGYLLGEYSEKTKEIHEISIATGLSQRAIENIIENKKNPCLIYANYLHEYGFMRGFFDEFSLYINSKNISLPKNNSELESVFDSDASGDKIGEYITAAFTADVYGHVSEKMKQESAARMQSYFEKIKA